MNKTESELIKCTGMKLKPLALALDIAYDTMLAYSCGRRKMPPEVVERLNGIIKVLKVKSPKVKKLSDEEENELMQKISDEYDKKRRDPLLQRLMDATGLSEKEVMNLKFSDIEGDTISIKR